MFGSVQKRAKGGVSAARAPVLREFIKSAKGVFFRAARQRRNSADEKRRGAPVLREFLRRGTPQTKAARALVLREFLKGAKGVSSRAAVQERNTADQSGAGARFARVPQEPL
jgi:hypothetical protein